MIDRNIFTVKKLTLGITFVLIFTVLLSACGPVPRPRRRPPSRRRSPRNQSLRMFR